MILTVMQRLNQFRELTIAFFCHYSDTAITAKSQITLHETNNTAPAYTDYLKC